MTGPTTVVDFFALEAGEYLDRLDALIAAATAGARPDGGALATTARALRGSATMARQHELTDLGGAIERTAIALRARTLVWRPAVADALTAAIDEFRALLRVGRTWDAKAVDRARRRAQELRALTPADAPAGEAPRIVAVGTLFYDDAGPHVLVRAPTPPITADQRFRQAAVPLASTLRRLVAEARASGPASETTTLSLGEDLRAALGDLRELAASYAIAPVVNFATARESLVARLDAQALDTVDSAASALIESAGTAWARPTPAGGADTVAAATPEAEVTPPRAPEAAATVAPAVESRESTPPRTPPTGDALVALLESGISGITQIDQQALAADLLAPAPRPDAPDGPTDAAPPPNDDVAAGEIVAVETLVYRGPRALERARAVRDALRAGAYPPPPELLDELYDLLDLAETA